MKKMLLLSFLLLSVQCQFAFAQRNICGVVTDSSTGEALMGITVLLKGTTTGTLTDVDGKYCLEIPADAKSDELVFSYIGFENKTVKIADSNVLNTNMVESKLSLDEVVIMSYDAPKSSTKKRSKSKTSVFIPPSESPSVVRESISSSSASYSSASEKSAKKVVPTSAIRTKDVSDFRESPKPLGSSFEAEESMESLDGFMMMSSEDYGGDYSETYEPTTRAGLLTAGEINDFSKWKMWQDMADSELKRHQNVWRFFSEGRYTVQVSTEEGKPLVDAEVRLLTSKKEIHWSAKTDNTGKAELWLQMFEGAEIDLDKLKVEVVYEGKTETIKNPSLFKKEINFVSMKANCNMPKRADILFVVDATSSMGDEINYLKAELKDVITQIQTQRTDLDINLGSVFYRDKGDEYLTKKSDFSTNIDQTIQFIQNNRAAGGGDYEEAVEDALQVGIEEMKWSKNAVARLLFLVLDAPPHQTPEIKAQLHELSKKAAAKGIRIIPITASGLNKSTEFLMRSLALATNGTYTFLTDHSGIGGSHIEPSTDDYDMEFLNDLLVRLIDQFTKTPDCAENTDLVEAAKANPISDEVLETLNFYPNPVVNELTIELKTSVEELFIADLSGKILQRLEKLQEGKVTVDMSRYPSGIYFVRYATIEGKEGSAKLVVQ